MLGGLRARPNEIKARSSRPTCKNCSLWLCNVHCWNATQYYSTETVLLIFPFLRTNITVKMRPSGGWGGTLQIRIIFVFGWLINNIHYNHHHCLVVVWNQESADRTTSTEAVDARQTMRIPLRVDVQFVYFKWKWPLPFAIFSVKTLTKYPEWFDINPLHSGVVISLLWH